MSGKARRVTAAKKSKKKVNPQKKLKSFFKTERPKDHRWQESLQRYVYHPPGYPNPVGETGIKPKGPFCINCQLEPCCVSASIGCNWFEHKSMYYVLRRNMTMDEAREAMAGETEDMLIGWITKTRFKKLNKGNLPLCFYEQMDKIFPTAPSETYSSEEEEECEFEYNQEENMNEGQFVTMLEELQED